MQSVATRLYTVCVVQDGDRVLLINQMNDSVIRGYIPPGGKVEFPESPLEAAVREVREETGLEVSGLAYKGLHEFVNEEIGERYMIFNYHTTTFTGRLLADPPEGEPAWVRLSEVDGLPMPPSVRRRFPLLFAPGTFEIHTRWREGAGVLHEQVTRT